MMVDAGTVAAYRRAQTHGTTLPYSDLHTAVLSLQLYYVFMPCFTRIQVCMTMPRIRMAMAQRAWVQARDDGQCRVQLYSDQRGACAKGTAYSRNAQILD